MERSRCWPSFVSQLTSTCWMEDGDSGALCWAKKHLHTDAIQSLLLQISETVTAAGLIDSFFLCSLVCTQCTHRQDKSTLTVFTQTYQWLHILQHITFNRLDDNTIPIDGRHWSPGHTDTRVVWPYHAHTADPQAGWRETQTQSWAKLKPDKQPTGSVRVYICTQVVLLSLVSLLGQNTNF